MRALLLLSLLPTCLNNETSKIPNCNFSCNDNSFMCYAVCNGIMDGVDN